MGGGGGGEREGGNDGKIHGQKKRKNDEKKKKASSPEVELGHKGVVPYQAQRLPRPESCRHGQCNHDR